MVRRWDVDGHSSHVAGDVSLSELKDARHGYFDNSSLLDSVVQFGIGILT